jgi:RimJ/RimL family protein N-acetyltransferase
MNFWQGEKVRLRALEPSDWEFFFQLSQDSQRIRYQDFLWPPVSQEYIRTWVLEQSKKKLEEDIYFWVIANTEGNPVGSIDTHHCDHRTGCFSYGIDIAPEFKRKGYASEAIRMVLKYYFEELRYQKVTVYVHSDNPASIGLHEKLGFKKEGIIRRMVLNAGQFYDMLWYGMLKEEFKDTI